LTRDIANRFNSLYGDTFVVPDTQLPLSGARVMGLDDPTVKMRKSAAGSGHAIALLDAPDVARKKIMRATTDSQPHVDFGNLSPGVLNLIDIAKAFEGWGTVQAHSTFDGMRYGDLKKKVAEIVVAHLEPLQKRYAEIMGEPGYLAGILKEGAERVSPIAKSTVQLVKERMGLY